MTKPNKHPEPPDADIINKVMLQGDLSDLTDDQRVTYYKQVCETLGLNPLTKPFEYATFDGRLALYAKKDATEQLRKRYNISVKITDREKQETIYVVTAQATLPSGRSDESIGAVPTVGKKQNGEQFDFTGIGLANAVMKAETKAKRRVTLSICGIGMLDESELDQVTDAAIGVSSAIIERNVREATANARTAPDVVTGERIEFVQEKADKHNEYGPLEITEANYKDLTSHVGKAQGRILGYKVGEMDENVIKWMYNKWRDSLSPNATEQDFRLKKAIEFAYNVILSSGDKNEKPVGPAETAMHDIGARQACLNDLRQRIEELVLTEEQACKYLHQFGLFGQGWTTFNDAPDGLLLHLATPQGWQTFKTLLEAEVKPKTVEKPVKKTARKR